MIRELAKCMDQATKGTYLEMLRVVKFVNDNNKNCLQIQPEFKGKIGLSTYFEIMTEPEILKQVSE
jgi:hypothetical protein